MNIKTSQICQKRVCLFFISVFVQAAVCMTVTYHNALHWCLLIAGDQESEGQCHPSFGYLARRDVQPQPPPTCTEAERKEEHGLKPRYFSIMRPWVLFKGCV